MLVLGFPLGFFLSGNFSGFGSFLTELFPSRVRGSGPGLRLQLRAGLRRIRAAGGRLSQQHRSGLTQAIGIVTGLSFALAVVALAFLPETRGKQLLVYD